MPAYFKPPTLCIATMPSGIAIKYVKSFTNLSAKVLPFSPFGALNVWINMSAKIPACIATAILPPANLFVQPSRSHESALGKNLPNAVLLPWPRAALYLFRYSFSETCLPKRWFCILPRLPLLRQIGTTTSPSFVAFFNACITLSGCDKMSPLTFSNSATDSKPNRLIFKRFAYRSRTSSFLPASLSGFTPNNSSSFFWIARAFSA